VERSLDQKTWDVQVGADALSDTSYTDKSTTFNVHYYYRVHAVDTSGNQGGLATTDVTTQSFQSNTSSGSDTSITSDDNLLVATIPAGAVSSDASCTLLGDTSNKTSLPTKYVLAAGPYSLVCRDSTGKSIDTFNTDVTISLNTGSKQFSNLEKLTYYRYSTDSSAWVPMPTKTDSKTKIITTTTSISLELAVLGSTKPGFPFQLIFIIILILLIIGGFLYFRQRQIKKQQYDEYIRHKYYEL